MHMVTTSILTLFITTTILAEQPADVVYTNAVIYTSNSKQPTAKSVAILGGKFVAVGSVEEVAKSIGPETQVIDAQGQVIVPGFIDAHCHPGPLYDEDSRWYVVDVSPSAVKSIDELVAALKKKADRTPRGVWVRGSGYQETKLGRHPTRADLDRVSTEHPIIISHSSSHLAACNSLALKNAAVTKDTKDPPGGAFDRDQQGEPTGLLKEGAVGIVRSNGPKTPDPPAEELLLAYRRCLRKFVEQGITGVHVAGTDPATARLLRKAADEKTPLRMYIMLRESRIEAASELTKDPKANDSQIHYGAIKFFHGNSLSGQTCWLSKPYADRPDYFGVPPARSQKQLDALVESIHNAGLQACIHCNGDREIDMVVTAFERILAKTPRKDHRHRLEHCSVVTDGLLNRIRDAGLVVAPHSYVWEHGDKLEAYGKDRWDMMHPGKSLFEKGIPIAGNSDYPVSAAIPLLRIHDMVNRKSAEGKEYGGRQKTTPAQALHAFTLGAAYAGFDESKRGSIEPGKLADCVFLSADPMTVKPEDIRAIRVLRTMIGGQVVYETK